MIVHPILLAAFPVLFLYSRNRVEAGADQVPLPMLLSLAGVSLLWLLFAVLMRSARKSAVATTVCLSFFFAYGHLHDLFQRWGVPWSRHSRLLPVMLLACGYSVYFVSIARRSFERTTRALNGAAVFLVAINLSTAALHWIGQPALRADAPRAGLDASSRSTGESRAGLLPDIYYIVLDEYAHPDTMRRFYGYVDAPLVAHLEERGFFVASASQSPAHSSIRSIASVLNMEPVPADDADGLVWGRIRNNRVTAFLRSRGYSIVYIGSWFDDGIYEGGADTYRNFYSSGAGGSLSGAFPHTFWNTTMLAPFYDRLVRTHFETYYRGGLMATIEYLKELPRAPGPKFVFAHVLCPHEPFVFGRLGEVVSPTNWNNYADKRYYRDQYIFISHEMSRVVDSLLARSAAQPIVVVQSDHGLRAHHPGIQVPNDEWLKILNAYYAPRAEEALFDAVSPMQTFRLIFERYFGAGEVPGER
ncbi:MAG: hypothetical protein ACE148_12770 [Vicinamibacterales bacterium]